jgi:hypothetical protein
MGVLREAAQTETQFQKTVDPLSDETSTEEVEKIVSPIISQHRIDLIKKAFHIETYHMNVVKIYTGLSRLKYSEVELNFIQNSSEFLRRSRKCKLISKCKLSS